jgi:outer membrane protein insertion porin family
MVGVSTHESKPLILVIEFPHACVVLMIPPPPETKPFRLHLPRDPSFALTFIAFSLLWVLVQVGGRSRGRFEPDRGFVVWLNTIAQKMVYSHHWQPFLPYKELPPAMLSPILAHRPSHCVPSSWQRWWAWCALTGVILAVATTTTVPVHAETSVPVDPSAQTVSTTPASEFAPESVPSLPTEQYDQGVSIQTVDIEGNKLIPDSQIKQIMAIKPGTLYSKKTLQEDLRRIYDMGYFSENIKAVPVATSSGLILHIRVEENVPVTGIAIEGNSQLNPEELQSIFESQTGLPQNITQLNKSIEEIEAKYAAKGFVLARVVSIQDDPDGQVTLKIDEGQIDKVQFVGNRKTKTAVLERNMLTKPGEPYNEKTLGDDLKRLYSLQAFDDVRRVITASPDNPDHYNLVVEVDEKRSGAISLGGGFDTGTGLFGTVGYTDPNFLGRGQNFNTAFGVGSGVIGRDQTQANRRTYQFDMSWSTPELGKSGNSLAVNLSGRDFGSFNVPLAVERRLGGGLTVARAFESIPNTSGSLGLRLENVTLREGAGNTLTQDFPLAGPAFRQPQLDQEGTFLSLSPTVAFDTRDNRINPENGWFNTASLTGALGLGASSYGSTTVNLRRYIKIRDGLSLALNAQAGSNLLNDIPEFNQFRMGGMFSVRGFQEGGLGVGNQYLLGSAELRSKIPFVSKLEEKIPFINNIRLVAFADGGSLFDEPASNAVFKRTGSGYSVGVGVRVDMPGVGPIRVDYAIPLGNFNSEYTRRFNFGVGQKF